MKKAILSLAFAALIGTAFTAIAGTADLQQGLVAHYPFNGNANDESGNGNNGTAQGALLTTDRFGNANAAQSFDGVNDYIEVQSGGAALNAIGSGSFSTVFWLKSSQPDGIILLKRETFGQHWPFQIQLISAGKIDFSQQSGGVNNLKTAASVSDGLWHNVCFIRDVAAQQIKCYVDGVLDNTGASDTADWKNSSKLYIGADVAAPDPFKHFYAGIIDDIRIYNRVLTEAEVKALYNEGRPEIVGTSPQRNALAVNKAANITVTFNTDINPATLNSSTIKVHGSQSGLHTSSITYNSGTKTVTINPDSDFKIGEVVMVTLTTKIQSTSGAPLSSPYSWSFTIDVAGGAGSFVKSAETRVRGADRLTTSDFDGDGDLDLAITNADTTTITILKNNGSGNFTKTALVGVGGRPNGITNGDFDGDGDSDLAVPNSPYLGLGAVSILKNNGSGGFSLTQRLTVGYMPNSASARDLDGDGDLDLAVSMNGSGGTANSGVTILINDGNGVFTQSPTIDAPGCEFPSTAGDWDGDGDFDLAVPSHCSFGVSILKNNGSGDFTVMSTVDAGNYPADVAAGDLDGDGDLDLAVPNRNDASLSNSTVTILKNDGTGNFIKTSSPGISGANPVSVTLGDFDHDGDLDVATNNAPSNTVSILLNDGAGNFINSAQPASGSGANCLLTGDFDGDGDLDLAVTNSGANAGVAILKKVSPQVLPVVATPQTAGSEFWVYVTVGTNSVPAAKLFGVSFTLEFTQTNYLDVATPYSSNILTGAFIGASNDLVFHYNVDEANGKINAGISRKSGLGSVNGYGTVFRAKFVSSSCAPNATPIKFSISNVVAIDGAGAALTLGAGAKTITINNAGGEPIVWPGDTNNDKIVNHIDVLPLGTYWGRTGPIRPNASLTWIGQPSLCWNPPNAVYADANGDGKIDQTDVLAIGFNYDKSHTSPALFADGKIEKVEALQNATIAPMVSSSGFAPNQEFFISLKVDAASNLFGLAFELSHDQPQLLQVLAVELDSLLGQDLIFYSNVDATRGKIAAGISRKAPSSGISGSGAVVRVKAKIAATARIGDKINLTLHNVAANDEKGSKLPLNAKGATLIVGVTTSVGEKEETSLPASYRLLQNHPNPFRATTAIRYELPQAGQVVLQVYNLAGQEILQLANHVQPAGRYTMNWNGHDQQGRAVPSGVYLCRLQAGGPSAGSGQAFVQTQRMVVVR
jgi:hypothetical protein